MEVRKLLLGALLVFVLMDVALDFYSRASVLQSTLEELLYTLILAATCGCVVYLRKGTVGYLFVAFGVVVFRIYGLYMANFWLEGTINVDEYASILGGEQVDFGSNSWFYGEVCLLLAILLTTFWIAFNEWQSTKSVVDGDDSKEK